ncbi:hypothetical protein Pla52o_39400 [Novipirellula galeiformis]|uniref:Uncharacterized protein n=1 Tax=Novipirellula galeiformis TaxID=2528004 RepID=A0A5C6CAL5_9BACT|nr:hypothetical protein Pla52o_39400 [Novipirellula galeiformis]
MRYELSQRQLSNLNESGRVLRVVVPASPDLPVDLRRWASERLPSVGALISSVKMIDVVCQPRQSKSEPGLAGLIGSIRDDFDESRFCIIVKVVEVTLTPQNVRGRVPRRQWPGGAIESFQTDSV